MLRGFIYLIVGWLLIAITGGLADVFGLTIVLPATSVVVVAHAAFTGDRRFILGLAVAVSLGYIDDLHQGAPVGTLALALALTFVALHWAASRVSVGSWVTRSLMLVMAVVVLDGTTVAVLAILAESLGIRPQALWTMVTGLHWHILATWLVAPPIWALFDRVFVLTRQEQHPQSHLHLDVR